MVAAAQTLYRQEMIKTFEVRKSLLLDTTTKEMQRTGNQAVFLVNGSGGATATTRGVNGRIPARSNANTQVPVTLSEWHDKAEMTGFDIFASQGDQRSALQVESMGVINRKIDSQIITELNTGTLGTGAAVTASEDLVLKSITILQNNAIPWDRRIIGLITPAFHAYLLKIDSFRSADYVEIRPMPKNDGAWMDMPNVRHWAGVNWIVHPSLPGVGTNAEKCFMYHTSAIGYACDAADIKTEIGYNSEDDYSWCRSAIYSGCELLQNSGVVVMNHDGSAFVAS